MNTHVKKQTTVIALIFALIASVVIGATCFVSSAFADNADTTDTKTASTEAKLIATFDDDGTITIPKATIKNDTDYVVTIDEVSIASDYDFVKDWTSDAQGKTINPGESLTASWSAPSKVPASFDGTTEVKVGTITYTYSYKVNDPLTGDVSITNNNDGTLTAKAENLPSGAKPHYTWYDQDGNKLGEGETYTPEDDAAGKTITVKVTDESGTYSGEIESSDSIKSLDFSKAGLEQNEYTYDGNEKKPGITGLDGLEEDKDYKVEYKNNTNAGTATVVITGIGDYTGTKTLEFAINKVNISATIDPAEFTYDGEVKTPTIKGLDGLEEGKDYTISGDISATDAGTYTIKVAGKGNYEGKEVLTFTIHPVDISQAQIEITTEALTYNGTEQTAIITGVTLNGKKFSDYTVASGNTGKNAGTYEELTITGTNNYTGTATGSFTIKQLDISNADVVIATIPSPAIYTGDTVEAEISRVSLDGVDFQEGDWTGPSEGSVSSASAAGTYDMYVLGQGNNCTGKAHGTWTIGAQTLNDATITIENPTYNGEEQSVYPEVKIGEKLLTLGTDYVIDGESNKATNVSEQGYQLKIKGIGNYAGSEKTQSWNINPLSLEGATLTITTDSEDNVYTGSDITATVTQATLTSGKVVNLTSDDFTTAGTIQAKNADTYYVTITGKGNYKDTSNQGTWTIKPKQVTEEELNNITLSIPKDGYTYDGEEKEPGVTGIPEGLVKGTDYDIVYSNNVNAGTNTAKVTVTFKGNYKGEKELSFTIKKAPITVSGITASEKEYDGNTRATLSCTNAQLTGLVAGEELSVTATGTFDNADGNGKNVGTNKTVNISDLTLTGDDDVLANYELATTGQQTTATANITAREVTITWDPSGDASYPYDEKTHTPIATIGKVVNGESLTASLTYTTSSGTALSGAPSAVGTYVATVGLTAGAGTTVSNYVLPAAGKTKNFAITTDKTFTIVYHGNGGTKDGDGTTTTYTQTCTADTAGTLTTNAFKNGDKTFGFWTLGTATDNSITTTSTKTCVDQHKFTATGDGIISSTTKGTTIHLWAYWLDEGAGDYWMENANSTYPANAEYSGQTKTQVTKGQSAIDTNKNSTDFWNALYNNGTDTESHLYTIWKEDTVQTFADRFVEFRIIQVGEHLNDSTDSNSGDGSTVTFMATHSLPTAKAMNNERTNAGGWIGSEMYKTVFGSGSNTEGYVATGLSGLKDAVKSVTKKSTAGNKTDGWTETTSTDAFWLISYSELFGEDKGYISSGYFKNEGSQYAWCTTNVTNPTGTNDDIKNMDKTRDGSSSPAGVYYTGWWERSPRVNNTSFFGRVSTGSPYYTYSSADYTSGVVPAFSF